MQEEVPEVMARAQAELEGLKTNYRKEQWELPFDGRGNGGLDQARASNRVAYEQGEKGTFS